jgi:hypothetical protein
MVSFEYKWIKSPYFEIMKYNTQKLRYHLRGDWMGRSFRWDWVNRGPVSQQVWNDEDPSLLKGPERQA